MTRLGRLLCAWRGHDDVFAYESGRVFLRCSSCGDESVGLTPAPRPPRLTVPGKPHRLRLAGLRSPAPLLRRSA